MKKTGFVFDKLSNAKNAIGSALGVPPEQVDLGVAIHCHFTLIPDPPVDYAKAHWKLPTSDELNAAVKQFQAIGDVHLSELDVVDAPSQDQRASELTRIVHTGVVAGVKSISFWEPLRLVPITQVEKDGYFEYQGLFDASYQPTADFNRIRDDLATLIPAS